MSLKHDSWLRFKVPDVSGQVYTIKDYQNGEYISKNDFLLTIKQIQKEVNYVLDRACQGAYEDGYLAGRDNDYET